MTGRIEITVRIDCLINIMIVTIILQYVGEVNRLRVQLAM